MDLPGAPPRRSLFKKYFLVLFTAVIVPLLISGLGDAWFGYRDQRDLLDARLRLEAKAAAARIESFLSGIGDQLGWTVQQAWTERAGEQRRLDALGLLRQVPAVIDILLVDGDGRERLYLSRVGLNRVDSRTDRSGDAAVDGARSARIWYGPVTYYRDSEPFMTIAVAGNRKAAGIAVAEINLKLIWDVIAAIRVGDTGHAFVVDEPGRLIAHPDISKVLRGTDPETAEAMRRLREEIEAVGGAARTAEVTGGETVLVATAPVPGVNWTVFVEQPLAEAFGPIYFALWRAGVLLLAGAGFAGLMAYWLAARMTGPIRLLEDGTRRIGAGQFDHRIDIATGDELERLATGFNRMAGDLAISQERSERIARLKRFLAPQVAELVEKAGHQGLLAGQRAEVVAVFCDLRGFTAFSARTEPDKIMHVLRDYYEALGAVITRHEATLTSFSGDGLMVLVNAPVPCAEPAIRAVEMAVDMQKTVQTLIRVWRSSGHGIGFGIGLAMGPATVGQIGYENRLDYTAIGNVVNLASRLCSSAEDGQILVDSIAAEAVGPTLPLRPLGTRSFKGYDKPLPVFDAGPPR